MDAFSAYIKYIALKRHFNSNYDYFKYGGKITAKASSFETRKDKYMFHKLSKIKDIEGFLVSNFLYDSDIWVGNLFNSQSTERYNEWLKRQQSITYTFENDIEKFLDDLNANFIVEQGNHPYTLKMFLRNEICLETLIICDSILGFFKHWNKHVSDPIIWPDLFKKIEKYKPFMKFDKTACKKIIKNRFV